MRAFAVVALAGLAQAATGDKCYALALSSGDQNSIYQGGVLAGLAAAGESI